MAGEARQAKNKSKITEKIHTCIQSVDSGSLSVLAALGKEARMPFHPNPDGSWREVQADYTTIIRPSVPDSEVPDNEKKAAQEKVKAILAASGPSDPLVRWWNSAMSMLGRRDDRL